MVLLLWHGSIWKTFISNNSTIWQNNSITQKTCNRKYTWLHVLLLPPSGYSIWGTENCIYQYLTYLSWLYQHITGIIMTTFNVILYVLKEYKMIFELQIAAEITQFPFKTTGGITKKCYIDKDFTNLQWTTVPNHFNFICLQWWWHFSHVWVLQ